MKGLPDGVSKRGILLSMYNFVFSFDQNLFVVTHLTKRYEQRKFINNINYTSIEILLKFMYRILISLFQLSVGCTDIQE